MVYPIRIVKPLKKIQIDQNEQLAKVLADIHENGCIIDEYIGDKPKRSNAKCILGHSSWFPCEYCYAKGTRVNVNSNDDKKKREGLQMQKDIIKEKIESIKHKSHNSSQMLRLKNLEKKLTIEENKLKPKKTNIVWPKTTMDCEPRTKESLREIIEKLENNQPMTQDESKGVTGRSLLFDIPYFDYITDAPVEYLHGVCLGQVKKCVELTFKVGETRSRVTKRKLSLPSQFNSQIHNVKVFREFNRRIRDLDFSVYKGQEFRNLLLFFFPLILNCIEPNNKERHMWLYLTYMIKACVVPKEEFTPLDLGIIERCTKQFYSLYQQLFGVRNCTYTIHTVSSHLIVMRYKGPLTETSAFPFESFYSELRNSFVPGTPSTLKQILENVLIKRVITHHQCANDIYISEKETAMEANNLIYCYRHMEYTVYKVMSVDSDMLSCYLYETLPCSFIETPELPWNMIGVFKKGMIVEENVIIMKKDVKGKVIAVEDLLITCPLNVLREK